MTTLHCDKCLTSIDPQDTHDRIDITSSFARYTLCAQCGTIIMSALTIPQKELPVIQLEA